MSCSIRTLCVRGAMIALTLPVATPALADEPRIKLATTWNAGAYSELDPSVAEVQTATVSTSLGKWQLRSETEWHRSELRPELEHLRPLDGSATRNFREGPTQVANFNVSVTRFERVAPRLWVYGSAKLHMVSDNSLEDVYAHDASVGSGLYMALDKTDVWVEQRRDLYSSERYDVRNAWHSEAGFSRKLDKDARIGMMASRTQYPFASWDAVSSISAFYEKETREGPIKSWLALQQYGGHTGVSAAASLRFTF